MTNHDATDQQITWDPKKFMRAQVELVKAGLKQLDAGIDHFGPDDIDEDLTFGNIMGSATRSLRIAHVIRHCGLDDPFQGIHHGARISKRKSAKGRPVKLYSLCSRGAALAFLKRHEEEARPLQRDLAI